MKKHILKFIVLFSFMISGCSIDLETKDIVKTRIKNESIAVIDHFFNLTYVENHAIAFGLLQNVEQNIRFPLILGLPFLATLFGFFWVWRMRAAPFRLLLPVFLVLGGAYGNIADRAMHGYVTDFFHLHYYDDYHFYVFNVADLLINVGIGLILLQWKTFLTMSYKL
jgi:signal peptidase II